MTTYTLSARRLHLPRGMIKPLAIGDNLWVALNETALKRQMIIRTGKGWYAYPSTLLDHPEKSYRERYRCVVSRSSKTIWFFYEDRLVHATFDDALNIHARVIKVHNQWFPLEATDDACLVCDMMHITRITLVGDRITEEILFRNPDIITSVHKLSDEKGLLFKLRANNEVNRTVLFHVTPEWEGRLISFPDSLSFFGGYFTRFEVRGKEIVVGYTKDPTEDSSSQWEQMRLRFPDDVYTWSTDRFAIAESGDKLFLVRYPSSLLYPRSLELEQILTNDDRMYLFRIQDGGRLEPPDVRLSTDSSIFKWNEYLCVVSKEKIKIGGLNGHFFVFDPHHDCWLQNFPDDMKELGQDQDQDESSIVNKKPFWVHSKEKNLNLIKVTEISPKEQINEAPRTVWHLAAIPDILFAASGDGHTIHCSYGSPSWQCYDLRQPGLYHQTIHLIPIPEGRGFWTNNLNDRACLGSVERDGTLLLRIYGRCYHSIRCVHHNLHCFSSGNHVVAFVQEGDEFREVFSVRLPYPPLRIVAANDGFILIYPTSELVHLSPDGKETSLPLPISSSKVYVGHEGNYFAVYSKSSKVKKLYYTRDPRTGWKTIKLNAPLEGNIEVAILEISDKSFLLISKKERNTMLSSQLYRLPQHENGDVMEIAALDTPVSGVAFKDFIVMHHSKEHATVYRSDDKVLSVRGNLIFYSVTDGRITDNFYLQPLGNLRFASCDLDIPHTWKFESERIHHDQ